MFLENPLTGIGAGQFRNYNGAGSGRAMARDAQRVAAGGGRARHLRPVDVRVPGRACVRGVSRCCECSGAARRVDCGLRLADRGRQAARRNPRSNPQSAIRDPQHDDPNTNCRPKSAASSRSIAKGMTAAIVAGRLRALRVGRVQLDVLLRARARRGGPRDRRPPPCRGGVRRPRARAAAGQSARMIVVRRRVGQRRILVDAGRR